MSRRRRATLAPTLFPFLAVLVCTLGTLILLLALVAQKADETAQQAAAEKAADQLDTQQAVATQQWLRTELASHRKQQTAILERRRSELAHLEERERHLRQELQRLQDEMETAEKPTADPAQLQRTIAALKSEVETERQRLEERKAETQGQRPRVIITAHKGPYGTERRPIYVECTEDAVILQPEGARIALSELADAIGPGNPLDAALRAVRLHWQKTEPDSPAPYPLLVVRPDGIATYAAARQAMSSWDEQFGYELIPAELELAFPKADSRLRRELDVAIRDALAQQRRRVASSQRSRYERFSGRGRPPVLSAAALARGGSGSEGSFFNRQVDSRSQSSTSQLHPDDIRDFDDAMKAAAAGSGPSLGAASEPALATGDQAESRLPSSGLTAGRSGETGGWSTESRDAESGMDTDAGGGGGRSADMTTASRWNGASPGLGRTSAGGGQADSLGPVGARGASGRESSRDAAEGPSATSSSFSSSGSTGTGGPNSSGSQAAAQAEAGGKSAQSSSQRAQGSKAASDPRLQPDGRDWALPDEVRRSRGASIERRIEVVCRPEAFFLAPDRPGGKWQAFSCTEQSVEQAVFEMATVVHDRVDSWGVALANGRWQPILRVAVQGDAASRYQTLQTLLRGSGLNIEPR